MPSAGEGGSAPSVFLVRCDHDAESRYNVRDAYLFGALSTVTRGNLSSTDNCTAPQHRIKPKRKCTPHRTVVSKQSPHDGAPSTGRPHGTTPLDLENENLTAPYDSKKIATHGILRYDFKNTKIAPRRGSKPWKKSEMR